MGPSEEDNTTPLPEEKPVEQPVEPALVPEEVVVTEQPVVSQPVEPVIASPVQPAQPVVALPIKKSSKKGLIIGLIIASVVLLGLAAAGVVYAFVYNSPENVVMDAFSKSLSAKSGSASGTATMKSDGTSFKVDFSSASSTSQQTSADVTVTVTGQDQKDYKLTGHFAGTKDAVYVKLDDVRSVISSALGSDYASAIDQYYGSLLKKIDGRWVVIKQSDLDSASSGAISNKESQCIQSEVVKLQNDASTRDEVMNVYRKNPLFTVASKGSDSDGNRYSLTPVSSDKAKSFANAFVETKFFKALDDCTSSDLKKSFTSDSTSTSSDKSTGTIDVWVDGWSHNLNKVAVNLKSDTSELTSEFKTKFNNNPSVTIPKGETTFDDLKTEIQGIEEQLVSSYSPSSSASAYAY